MSTFDGKIEEISDISVDRFDGENINSTIYFLSHCHTDHMHGLADWAFQSSLVSRPEVSLYASPISVKILKTLYPSIELKLKELSMYNSTLIKFPYRDDRSLTVTPMPAGHCPGSVMFLFETEKNILYTGDYRVSANDLKKYKAFYSFGQLKKIDTLYLDTTFLKLSFLKLPSREDSFKNICEIIKEWTDKSKNHIIKIIPSASYGSEYLFLEISKNLCMPIHVNSDTHRFYKCIPELDEAVTVNRRETQIHAGCGKRLAYICENDNKLIRVIKPSTLWWENSDFDNGITAITKPEEYRVCYSCHASYEEIVAFLMFLQPLEIKACVVPSNPKEKEIMLALIQKIMKIYKHQPKQHSINVKLCSDMAPNASNRDDTVSRTAERIDNIPENILCSPSEKFKRRRLWLNENRKEDN